MLESFAPRRHRSLLNFDLSPLNFDLSPAPSRYLLRTEREREGERREREGEGEMIDRRSSSTIFRNIMKHAGSKKNLFYPIN